MHASDSILAYANISNKSTSPYSSCSLAPFPPYCRIIHPSPPPFPPTVFVESLPHLSKTLLCSINSWWGSIPAVPSCQEKPQAFPEKVQTIIGNQGKMSTFYFGEDFICLHIYGGIAYTSLQTVLLHNATKSALWRRSLNIFFSSYVWRQ
jgi:hypothetical protein